ncbi:MAG: hypothetical protein EYC62_09740 [Alphaproteobacteria bacterium]|nr:MAG: hypothetical protein EYC62_09740 [Alphaproteobacteria bacterium]
MKKFTSSPLGNVIVALLIALGAIVLIYMWTDLFDEALFFKLIFTDLLLVILLGLIIAVKRDVDDTNKSKGDRYFN